MMLLVAFLVGSAVATKAEAIAVAGVDYPKGAQYEMTPPPEIYEKVEALALVEKRIVMPSPGKSQAKWSHGENRELFASGFWPSLRASLSFGTDPALQNYGGSPTMIAAAKSMDEGAPALQPLRTPIRVALEKTDGTEVVFEEYMNLYVVSGGFITAGKPTRRGHTFYVIPTGTGVITFRCQLKKALSNFRMTIVPGVGRMRIACCTSSTSFSSIDIPFGDGMMWVDKVAGTAAKNSFTPDITIIDIGAGYDVKEVTTDIGAGYDVKEVTRTATEFLKLLCVNPIAIAQAELAAYLLNPHDEHRELAVMVLADNAGTLAINIASMGDSIVAGTHMHDGWAFASHTDDDYIHLQTSSGSGNRYGMTSAGLAFGKGWYSASVSHDGSSSGTAAAFALSVGFGNWLYVSGVGWLANGSYYEDVPDDAYFTRTFYVF